MLNVPSGISFNQSITNATYHNKLRFTFTHTSVNTASGPGLGIWKIWSGGDRIYGYKNVLNRTGRTYEIDGNYNSEFINNVHATSMTVGSNKDKVLSVGRSNGVVEAGRYIDFHSGNYGTNDTEDYTARLDAGSASTARILTLPTTSGTLALTKDYVTALGTNGNYLTYTKNGSATNVTVPFATTSTVLDHKGSSVNTAPTNNTIHYDSNITRTNIGSLPVNDNANGILTASLHAAGTSGPYAT